MLSQCEIRVNYRLHFGGNLRGFLSLSQRFPALFFARELTQVKRDQRREGGSGGKGRARSLRGSGARVSGRRLLCRRTWRLIRNNCDNCVAALSDARGWQPGTAQRAAQPIVAEPCSAYGIRLSMAEKWEARGSLSLYSRKRLAGTGSMWKMTGRRERMINHPR